jgi:group I intron endonuclease
MQKYGYIYITTNLTNGKMYIGQAKFRNPSYDNMYLGSGVFLKKAVKKYGRKSFTKEIIFVADCLENLNWAERMFITEHSAVKSSKYYNFSPGGKASLGFTGKTHTAERNAKLSKKLMGHSVSKDTREAVGRAAKMRCGKNNYRAIRVDIFNSSGILQHSCHGDFQKVCKENSLPAMPLLISYSNNGIPIYQNNLGKVKDQNLKYRGWYAVRIPTPESGPISLRDPQNTSLAQSH